MSISSALLTTGAGDPQSGRIVDCGIIEREVLELLHSYNASEKDLLDEEKGQGETLIIESNEYVELYFIWPIPLVFEEFAMD
jgi:hypothetical protein